MREMDSYTSVFADTGDNRVSVPRHPRNQGNAGPGPGLGAGVKTSLDCQHRLRRLAAGHFSLKTRELLLLYVAKSGPARAA